MSPKPNGSHEPEDPFQKMRDFTRRVLSVPKREIDQKIAHEKAAKKKRKPH